MQPPCEVKAGLKGYSLLCLFLLRIAILESKRLLWLCFKIIGIVIMVLECKGLHCFHHEGRIH